MNGKKLKISFVTVTIFFLCGTSFLIGNEKFERVVVDSEKTIPDCSKRGLDNKILFVGSKFCGFCVKAKPVVGKIIKENKLENYYKEYEMSDKKIAEDFKKYNIVVPYFPTVIVNCSPLLGAKSESDYKKALDAFVPKK